jgi:hypothetical protein
MSVTAFTFASSVVFDKRWNAIKEKQFDTLVCITGNFNFRSAPSNEGALVEF